MVAPIVPVAVPPEVLKRTMPPPVVIVFPAASLASADIVVLVPEVIEVSWTASSVFAALGAPGVTVIVGGVVATGIPLIVALRLLAVPLIAPVKTDE